MLMLAEKYLGKLWCAFLLSWRITITDIEVATDYAIYFAVYSGFDEDESKFCIILVYISSLCVYHVTEVVQAVLDICCNY